MGLGGQNHDPLGVGEGVGGWLGRQAGTQKCLVGPPGVGKKKYGVCMKITHIVQ